STPTRASTATRWTSRATSATPTARACGWSRCATRWSTTPARGMWSEERSRSSRRPGPGASTASNPPARLRTCRGSAITAAGTTAIGTLDRPDARNTRVPPMLEELDAAVTAAIGDRAVKVILLQGAGTSFCAGFNFAGGFSYWNDQIATDGRYDAGRDLIMA